PADVLDLRAAIRRRRLAGGGRRVARAQSHRAASYPTGRRFGRACGRAAARHSALLCDGFHRGGDDAVADRSKHPSVLRFVLPALLVAAFILASTPAAEAHNTWTGGYRKWPWKAGVDRTVTTL